MFEVVFASSNEHKIKEINEISSCFDVEFVMPSKGFDPVENGETFTENAEIKAICAAKVEKQGRKLFLSDDSGLCIDALNGEPGLKSARYAQTNGERIEKVLKKLEDIEKRDAQFVCSMVLCNEKGEILHTTKGICKGKIAFNPNGTGGFGYDPIFIPDGYDCTIAELNDEEKNAISHRGKALRDMLIWIKLAKIC